MQVSNVGLTWTGLASRWDDLVGAKLIRRRVLRRYLDDGATPSPTGHWPDEPWFIEQKTSENKLSVTFALSTAFALDDVKLPKRLALRYTCSWTYRGEGCGYTGFPVADANDQPLANPMDPNLRAFFDALEQFYLAGDSVRINQERYHQAEIAYNDATRDPWKLQEERYITTGPGISYVFLYAPGTQGGALGYGFWLGALVPISTGTYRAKATGGIDYSDGAKVRPIQRWAVDQPTIDAAQAGVDAARVNLQASMAGQASWKAEALRLKPAADAVRDPRDQCSKTLRGCRARFIDYFSGNVPGLPTSAFPGLQIG
jgi:phage-related protein